MCLKCKPKPRQLRYEWHFFYQFIWRSIVQIVAKLFYLKKRRCVCSLLISCCFVFRIRVYYANMLLKFSYALFSFVFFFFLQRSFQLNSNEYFFSVFQCEAEQAWWRQFLWVSMTCRWDMNSLFLTESINRIVGFYFICSCFSVFSHLLVLFFRFLYLFFQSYIP